jgi:hypothetical protein
MTDRPIIFSAPMVLALLAGRKTQTRRYQFDDKGRLTTWGKLAVEWDRGERNQRVYVRENHQYWDWLEDGTPCIRYAADNATSWAKPTTDESAERCLEIWAALSDPANFKIDGAARDRDWRPSIHMPRWASRITLIVEAVKVERLQAISEGDAIAEGSRTVYGEPFQDGSAMSDRRRFELLWSSINGPDSWAANPWVGAVTFKVVRANIDSPTFAAIAASAGAPEVKAE